MKPSEIALHAKDIILDRGWIQGAEENGNGVCLSEAITLASKGTLLGDKDLVCKTLGSITDDGTIVCWNDEPTRIKHQVLDALDETARRLKEQGL